MYIIPCPIYDGGINQIPPITVEHLHKIEHFVVERTRTSRRYIRAAIPNFDIDATIFIELDKEHQNHLSELKEVLEAGHDLGIISESGTPCVADPGNGVVRLATIKYGYESIPLPGPSSIIMALSASGLNGQNFTFHGYLPVKEKDLLSSLNKLKIKIGSTTQIFIETPYRNDRLFAYLLKNLNGSDLLCIARDMGGPNQFIATKSISNWKTENLSIGKHPTIFLLGR